MNHNALKIDKLKIYCKLKNVNFTKYATFKIF